MAKKGLGRGFETLIPTDLFDETFDPTAADDHKVSDLRHIKLGDIVTDSEQPRKRFEDEALAELAQSIRQHGVLQPIVVSPKGKKFEIIAGERRYRASLLAELETIPAIVRTVSDQQKLEVALLENLQRTDLNPMETATAYAKLRGQFGMTLEQIGQAMGGKSVSAISNTIRLVRLPKEIQQAIVEGKLKEGQARPLIEFDPDLAVELLPRIIAEEWSARRIEAATRHMKQAEAKELREPEKVSPLYGRQMPCLVVTTRQSVLSRPKLAVDVS